MADDPKDPKVDPKPTPPVGDDTGEKGQTFTAEEVQELIGQKLRGQGKELTRTQADLAELAKWKADQEAALLSDSEKQQAKIADLEKRAAVADDLEKREAARIEVVSERNKERIKALPKDLQDLVPDGLGADPVSIWLDKFETKVQVVTRTVNGGGGRSGAAPDPDQKKKDHRAKIDKMRAAYFGEEESKEK